MTSGDRIYFVKIAVNVVKTAEFFVCILILGARTAATPDRMKEIPLCVKCYLAFQVTYKEVFYEKKSQLMWQTSLLL